MDIGCYCVNLSRMLFGDEPTEIDASVTRDPESGVDVLTAGILRFPDGVASFGCCTRAETDQRVHVYGTEGRLSVGIPFNIPPDRPTEVFVTAGGDPPVAPAHRGDHAPACRPVHRPGRALRRRGARRFPGADPHRGCRGQHAGAGADRAGAVVAPSRTFPRRSWCRVEGRGEGRVERSVAVVTPPRTSRRRPPARGCRRCGPGRRPRPRPRRTASPGPHARIAAPCAAPSAVAIEVTRVSRTSVTIRRQTALRLPPPVTRASNPSVWSSSRSSSRESRSPNATPSSTARVRWARVWCNVSPDEGASSRAGPGAVFARPTGTGGRAARPRPVPRHPLPR